MTPLRLLSLSAFAAAATFLGACAKGDDGFDARVRNYILSHPEVIQEAEDKLQAREAARQAAAAAEAIRAHRAEIERDPRDFVANPSGKVTVTEFYDYRCPHCINAAPAVLDLIRKDPNVRFVFKEFPIFGGPSDRAAAAAIAVRRAGGDYLGLYSDLMSTHPLDAAAVDRIAASRGIAAQTLDDPALKAAAAHDLDDVHKLATELGVDGTPAFVIGDTLVPGEDMDAVHAAIAAAEKAR